MTDRRKRQFDTPERAKQRSEIARMGAEAQHAKHDPRITTARAREVFLATLGGTAARKAYFMALAAKSAEVRRRRKPSLTSPSP